MTTSSNYTQVVLIIGMAGSGKSSLTLKLHQKLKQENIQHFLMNLDPSVKHLPFVPNVDIRDTVIDIFIR